MLSLQKSFWKMQEWKSPWLAQRFFGGRIITIVPHWPRAGHINKGILFYFKWLFRLKHYMSSWRAPNSRLNPKRFRHLFLRDDYWRCQKYISIVVGSPVCCISSVRVATPFNNKEKAPRRLSFLHTVVARHPMLSLLSIDRTPSLPLAHRFCESVEVHVK
jgi:hypothetical protein